MPKSKKRNQQPASGDPLRRILDWVPVGIEMPDDEMTVLTCNIQDPDSVCIAWHEAEEWRDCGSAYLIGPVTHWMPLPEIPDVQ
jgi:hypothetical protein